MGEIRTVTTLRRKREAIRKSIVAYEERLSQAKADLAHLNAAITIFEGAGEGANPRPYVDLHRLFAWREMITLAFKALEAQGPLDTRELTQAVMKAKGLDGGDKVLAKAIAYRMIQALRMQQKRAKLATLGKRRGVSVWALPSQAAVLPLTR